jgi:four helix bundle protein
METSASGNGRNLGGEYRVADGVGGFQRLAAWQKSMDLVEAVYRESRNWPRDETYGLVSQARRAAISIPSNIAEGHGRSGAREYAHHVSIAFGSLSELETQLLIAHRLGYSQDEQIDALMAQIVEVRRIIRGLLSSLRQRSASLDQPPI